MKTPLEIEAEKRDAKLKLDEESQLEKAKQLKEYWRNLETPRGFKGFFY
ncbi:MAG: hypothetical protein ACRCYO_13475 [Bacteroidia bacterium]